MRVFVTGGTGFVGCSAVRELRRRGHEVTALARQPAQAQEMHLLGVNVVKGSLEDEASLRAACAGADIVLHIAGLLAETDPGDFERVNVEGTRHVVSAARATPTVKQFVYVSSIAAAGPSRDGPLSEEGEPAPVSDYGLSKLKGEEICQRAVNHFSVTVIRPPVVYGPSDRNSFRLFQLAKLGIAPVVGAGDQALSLVHVEDLARALAQACERTQAGARTFYVSQGEPTSTEGLARQLGQVLGKRVRTVHVPKAIAQQAAWASERLSRLRGKPDLFNQDKVREMSAQGWACHSTRAQEELEWTPQIPLNQGLWETAQWYADEGWL